MIDETPIHRAPHGILLGVAVMTLFYVGMWMAFRLLYPAPALHCRPAASPAAITAPAYAAPCKPGGTACACAPR